MSQIKEGSTYKLFSVEGHTFDIKYGYYEDYERDSMFGELVPIYPDLAADPVYTEDGRPLVTKMQELCPRGNSLYMDGCCADCSHFSDREDLIGVCMCDDNKR